ncbi:phage tail protein [Salisaeta longa]|uniref:phage tail protein n=1 Tax=Salisaeta longa TaxID=503170 RepID=UPI0003B53C0B|nr:tail fiber protein [Salisaeta longa]
MSEPFLGEIRLMSFNFAPRGWALCNGQILPINQNQSLYSLLGTTYGGDGRTSFALPDLRGRVPVHAGAGLSLGASGGTEAHTLTAAEMPPHAHAYGGQSNAATTDDPIGAVFAETRTDFYASPDNRRSMAAGGVQQAGGGQAHTNMQPFSVVNFCIALRGLFPSRS